MYEDLHRPIPLGAESKWHYIREDDQAKHNDASPAHALQGSPDKHATNIMGKTAKQSADSKEGECHHEADGSSENVTDSSDKGHGDCIGQKIGGPNPEPLCSVAAEVGHNGL
jgi:hypothetical protein